MNIVDFYKRLSRILEMCREKSISYSDAQFRLSQLLEEAEKSNLDVEISDNILNIDNLINYDDEMSYEEDHSVESSYETSYYEGSEESSY